MKIDPNAPANPTYATGMLGEGLTIRAHFAAMAMQGLCVSMNSAECWQGLARASVLMADALIAELNK